MPKAHKMAELPHEILELDYFVVSGATIPVLSITVGVFIRAGFTPTGGVSGVPSPQGQLLIQAVMRVDKVPSLGILDAQVIKHAYKDAMTEARLEMN